MKKYVIIAWSILAYLFLTSEALAQWQVPNFAIPVGRGPGATGFRSITPSATANRPLVSQGVSLDPIYSGIIDVTQLNYGGVSMINCPPQNVNVLDNWIKPFNQGDGLVCMHANSALTTYYFNMFAPNPQVFMGNFQLSGHPIVGETVTINVISRTTPVTGAITPVNKSFHHLITMADIGANDAESISRINEDFLTQYLADTDLNALHSFLEHQPYPSGFSDQLIGIAHWEMLPLDLTGSTDGTHSITVSSSGALATPNNVRGGGVTDSFPSIGLVRVNPSSSGQPIQRAYQEQDLGPSLVMNTVTFGTFYSNGAWSALINSSGFNFNANGGSMILNASIYSFRGGPVIFEPANRATSTLDIGFGAAGKNPKDIYADGVVYASCLTTCASLVSSIAPTLNGLVTMTNNSGTNPAPVSGSIAQVVGADSVDAAVTFDSYGGQPNIALRRCDGTKGVAGAGCTAVQSGETIGRVGAWGWATSGTTYGAAASGQLDFVATQNFTATARGTRAVLYLTPNNSITQTAYYNFTSDGLTITGYANALTYNNLIITAQVASPTLTIGSGKTAAISNTLTFTGTDGSSVAFGTGGTVLYTAVTSLTATSPIARDVATGAVTISCATCIVASSPGAGLAHFAGSTQTVTSSLVVTADVTDNAVTLAKLATQATNTVLGNATAGTAVPTALAVGTCSTAASALIWTTNAGFSCNTSITASAIAVGGITGLGTGVATALAINVGTAGAFVVNGGALGSPSSAGTIPAFTLGGSISGNGQTVTNLASVAIRDTSAAFDVTIAATSSTALTAGRTLTLNVGNVAHTLAFGTTANTITFPNAASYTVAGLSVSQTFTAAQTMSSTLDVTGNFNVNTNKFSVVASSGNTTAGGTFTSTGVLTVTDVGYVRDGLTVGTTNTKTRTLSLDTPSAGGNSYASFNIQGVERILFGYENTNSWMTFYGQTKSDGTAGLGNIMNLLDTGAVQFPRNNASTSKTTGNIVNTGGIGNSGAIFTDTLSIITMANAATTSAVCYNTGTGLLTYDGTIGTCTVSDGNLKNVAGPITDALDRLLQIKGQYYTWKDASYGKGLKIGIIAQDVEKVFPELVSVDSEGKMSADYQRLVAPIIEAIRDLTERYNQLKIANDNLAIELQQRKAQ